MSETRKAQTLGVWIATGALLASPALAMKPKTPKPPVVDVVYSEEREPCADRNPTRNAYFGDLHVHTRYSFDAFGNGNRTFPEDAYAFAKGEPVDFPPYDENGNPAKRVRIDRPLDFVAVTDHAETMGEMAICSDEMHPGYSTPRCVTARTPGIEAPFAFIALSFSPKPERMLEVCGGTVEGCELASRSRWAEIRAATDAAYDRTSACTFTSLHGYEHTPTPLATNLHRNVIFRNSKVPESVVSMVEAPQEHMLWEQLDAQCLQGIPGCDVLAIPHNSNLSNGRMFRRVETGTLEGDRDRAKLRSIVEPLMEIFQHKAASECSSESLEGLLGTPDELCNFEEVRRLGTPYSSSVEIEGMQLESGVVEDCKGEVGNGGMGNGGCVASTDFLRGALGLGLQEQERLGVNPFKLGVIASTDTHLSNPGDVREATWNGHLGYEVSLAQRLNDGLMPSNRKGNAGGLAGVWAVENSRDAIFDALESREAFGTSGPRIRPRLFGGWEYPEDACESRDLPALGYAGGVPMGGDLPARAGKGAPRLIATAMRDAGMDSAPLERLQVVKGWLDAEGQAHFEVHDVAGAAGDAGHATLCSVFEDPNFDASRPAWYYLRVLEVPTKRWDTLQCEADGANAPEACTSVGTKWIRERAWSSPIWYAP